MVTTQSFRLLGKPDVKDIICDQVEGENVVVWEDIEQVFPGVKYITNGNTVISMMRDSNRNRVAPQCIKHYPGAILDVVLSTTISDNPLESTSDTSNAPNTEERPSASTMTLDLETEIVRRLTPNIQAQLRTTSNGFDLITQAAKDGQIDPSDVVRRCFHQLKAEMTKNMELSTRVVQLTEKKESQTQSFDQMALIRRRIQSLLTRKHDLHENPIPRLFVVLPMIHTSSLDSQDSFSNTFRLYFLCDCGDHTKSTNSETPHHIHLAKHEGYEITRPEEFFQKYGQYVLTVLQMLKFGISTEGTTVPTLSHFVEPVASCQTPADQQFLADTIESGMDLTIGYIEKVSEDKRDGTVRFAEQMEDSEALESADLRHMETFLKKKKDDKRTLGNLYRTVTSEGHARWICIDHFRENYQEETANTLRETTKLLKGSYSEKLGCAYVNLCSRDDADQLHLALEKTKTICELGIIFFWDATRSDFKRIRDSLARFHIGLLVLNFGLMSMYDIVARSRRYDDILDVIRHPSVHSVKVSLDTNFFQQSSLQTYNEYFPNLRHMTLHFLNDQDITGLKCMVAKAPNLSSLVLYGVSTRPLLFQIYNALAEHQTFLINSKDQSLIILPPTNKSELSITTLQDTADLLKFCGGRLETAELLENELDETIAAAFAKGTENGSCLKELTLKKAGRDLGRQGVKDLASLVARSALRKLDIHLENEEERARILESIQWKHIRELTVYMNEGNHGMGPLKALVDGLGMLSGRVEMDRFELQHVTPRRLLPIAQDQLLRSFVASTSLKQLLLHVLMTPNQIFSLLKTTNLSLLEQLSLLCEGFKSTEVDSILDKLQHARSLRCISVGNCDITEEQEVKAKAKGFTLSVFRML
ncbi:hypothetical protein BGX34_010945 [Mortierella sp. NVP85]|nr:hypothetical protein BGX34_010945 [Mortierella sp. NVP85]